VPARMITSAPL